jgi:GTP-binding protein
VLVHVVDASAPDPVRDAAIIRTELEAHNPALLEKTTLIALNKLDRPEAKEREAELTAAFRELGLHVLPISAAGGERGEGIAALRDALADLLPDAETLSYPAEPAGVVVHRINPIASVGFEVSREGEGFRVRGKAIERLVHQTDFARDESAERFQHELARQGIESALRKAGCRSGDTVMIGELSLEWDDPDDASLLNAAEEAEALELDGVLLAATPNNDGESEG